MQLMRTSSLTVACADATRLALAVDTHEPLLLMMMDAPCIMRSTATLVLDLAGLPWRIAFTSPGLSSVLAAVAAGLSVTVRT